MKKMIGLHNLKPIPLEPRPSNHGFSKKSCISALRTPRPKPNCESDGWLRAAPCCAQAAYNIEVQTQNLEAQAENLEAPTQNLKAQNQNLEAQTQNIEAQTQIMKS